MSIKTDEVPETAFAIKQYMDYCEAQIARSKSMIRKMKGRIKLANEKLIEMGREHAIL